jgi:hypothetical protein
MTRLFMHVRALQVQRHAGGWHGERHALRVLRLRHILLPGGAPRRWPGCLPAPPLIGMHTEASPRARLPIRPRKDHPVHPQLPGASVGRRSAGADGAAAAAVGRRAVTDSGGRGPRRLHVHGHRESLHARRVRREPCRRKRVTRSALGRQPLCHRRARAGAVVRQEPRCAQLLKRSRAWTGGSSAAERTVCGFRGRPNKPPVRCCAVSSAAAPMLRAAPVQDTCYSFWMGATLKILGGLRRSCAVVRACSEVAAAAVVQRTSSRTRPPTARST